MCNNYKHFKQAKITLIFIDQMMKLSYIRRMPFPTISELQLFIERTISINKLVV